MKSEGTHTPHPHKVLVVDDEAAVGRAIGRILKSQKLLFSIVRSGEEGVAALKETDRPFSLIISDQRMQGMPGTEFLAQARKISPNTIRFLMTGYSEMDTIIKAVNQGAVQYYIEKPWQPKDLVTTIQTGVRLYDRHLESQHLFGLAKKQTARLYELNRELMEIAKAHDRERKILDAEILDLEQQLSAQRPDANKIIARIQDVITSNMTEKPRLTPLYAATVKTLYDEFSNVAARNGIDLPPPGQGGSHG